MIGSHSAFKNIDRRGFVKVGGLTLFGHLTLGEIFKMQAEVPAPKKKDLNVILVWLSGGPSHIDSFDPKPDAPANFRGPFKTIPTKIPGIHFSEHMPMLAQRTDKYVLIRSMTSKIFDHAA